MGRIVLLLVIALGRPAYADEPPPRIEPTLLPGAGYDSNVGLAFGLTADVSATRPGASLHSARLYSFLFASVRVRGRPQFSRVVLHAQGDLPSLAGGRLRLMPRIFLRWFRAVGYYGIGQAAPASSPWAGLPQGSDAWADARTYQEYERLRGFGRLDLRYALGRSVDLFAGLGLTGARISPYPGSRLADDLAGGSGPAVARLLAAGAAPHLQVDGQLGVVWDRRDEETDTTRGFWHEASVRGGPVLPLDGTRATGWGAGNLTLRGYGSFLQDTFTVAVRGIADLMVGHPPLYELTSTGGSAPGDAFGGQTGVRGLPTWRYHGRIKLLATAELRFRLLRLRLLGRRAMIGGVLFVDGGRLWSGWRPDPALDGGPPVLATPGAGLRLRWGETFMLRADVAIGEGSWQLYVDVGSVF